MDTIVIGLIVVGGIAALGIIGCAVLAIRLVAEKGRYEDLLWSIEREKNKALEILAVAATKKGFLKHIADRAYRKDLAGSNSQQEAEKDLAFLRTVLDFLWTMTSRDNQDLAEFFRRTLHEYNSPRFMMKK